VGDKRALARDLTCSAITTRRVCEDLERERFVRTRSVRGTAVQVPEEAATGPRLALPVAQETLHKRKKD
jgi:DNA-binding transcriptional regulator YhcF (GntR family)